ncbi:MAG: DMT family transporter [Leptospira sp.]|nr:DMT family transporter [Leptospira sp.]
MIFRRESWKFSAEFFLILMTVIWGGTFISIKLALEEVTPFLFLFIRFGLALSVTLLIYLPRRKEIHLQSVFHGLWVGCILFSGYYFQTTGMEGTSATKSGFITGAYVIFTPLLEAIILRKFPSIRVLASVVIVFIGIFLISSDPLHTEGMLSLDSEDRSSSNTEFFLSKGEALTLMGALGFALYIVVIDRASRIWNESSLMVGQMISAFSIAFLLFLFLEPDFSWKEFSPGWNGWWGLVYTGLIATIVPTLVQTRYQKAVTPTRAGIIFSLEPVFASIFAFLAIGETLGLPAFLGCGLIFLGILLSIRSKD